MFVFFFKNRKIYKEAFPKFKPSTYIEEKLFLAFCEAGIQALIIMWCLANNFML